MLVHQLITTSEEITSDQTTWDQINQKLENALHTVQTAASIKLRSEMGNGIELIRWLSKWSARFREKNRLLLCIADDPAQRQSLELSHPDLGLRCISSLNELPEILNAATRTASELQQPDKSHSPTSSGLEKTDQSAPVPSAVSAITGTVQKRSACESLHLAETSIGSIPTIRPDEILVQQDAGIKVTDADKKLSQLQNETASDLKYSKKVVQDEIIEISGEYRCDNCGTTRMFCKGDFVLCCENRECISDRTSFTLQFDLF